MQIKIKEMMQSSVDDVIKIAHFIYSKNADENGLTPDEVDELCKLILDANATFEKSHEQYEKGYNEGYDEGYQEGYDTGLGDS